MIDPQTIAIYDAQAADYMALIQKQSMHKTLSNFIAYLKPNDYVLDLGCGPALSSATMREKGLRVDPVDASPSMVKLANNTFDIGARQATFSDISGQNIYDAVWASFSLLHAPKEDFPQILKALHQVLKPAGVFYLAMKTGIGSHRDKLGRLYSYYTQAELIRYLSETGFIVQDSEQGEDAGLSGEVSSWVAFTSLSNKAC